MLGLDGTFGLGDVILWVTFVNVNVTYGYGLWWGDVSSIFHLFLVEVCV